MYVVNVPGVGVVGTAALGPAVTATARVIRAEVTAGVGVGVTVGAGVEVEVEEGGWVLPTIAMITISMTTIIMTMAIISIMEEIIKMNKMKEEEGIIFQTKTKTKTKIILLRYPITKISLIKIEIQKEDIVLICSRKVLVFEVISVGIHMI